MGENGRLIYGNVHQEPAVGRDRILRSLQTTGSDDIGTGRESRRKEYNRRSARLERLPV